MGALKYAYKHIPIECRVGTGNYTYTFIVEFADYIKHYKIFANNIEEAINYTFLITNCNVLNYSYIDSNTIELVLQSVCNCRYFLYLV